MKKEWLLKTLALGVIVLFIGVAVQPGVSTNIKQEEKTDLVEVVVETCKNNGGKNHTVYLTQQQVQDLDDLFNAINFNLNNAKTHDEIVEIFNDAIVSINELGLLPEDMTVEEAQKLVTSGEQNPKIIKLLERWYNKHKGNLDTNENFLCLTAGHTFNTFFQGPIGRIQMPLLLFLAKLYIYSENFHLYLVTLLVFEGIIWSINPLPFGYEIGLGVIDITDPMGPHYYPAEGWFFTLGLNGRKFWRESFFGRLPLNPIISWYYMYFLGVLGFTGIKLSILLADIGFYLGCALWVKIDYSPP